MRLACLSTDPGIAWGGAKGASVHLAEIVGALADEGAEVLLLVSRIAPDAPPPPARVTLVELPGPRKSSQLDELIGADSLLADWLEERLRQFGAAALYERLALYSAAGSVAARALRIPHLVELNSPLLEEAAKYRQLDRPEDADRLERATLRAADLVLPVSSPLASHAAERGARRIEVMPNAVALDRFAGLPARDDAEAPICVFSGALRPWHGIETIAEAWRLLSDAAPRLLVVGDGPGRQLMEEIGADVTGAVPHDDVPALLMSAHIGLAPYSADAPNYFSPLKLFEYLAAGLAVVAADIPGIRDVVGDDGAALIPPGDAMMLAHAVAALAQSERERTRLGRNARSLAEEHTWDRRAQRILQAVSELSAREAARA
jgi:glycosyltransferase involved in cell wall biosynthesis